MLTLVYGKLVVKVRRSHKYGLYNNNILGPINNKNTHMHTFPTINSLVINNEQNE